ncbi:MAG: PD40 domain-containing protein [Muribaculaceae bacterium]|nr:PD40 domain-containing protein [Muribaculaceae bacterium]
MSHFFNIRRAATAFFIFASIAQTHAAVDYSVLTVNEEAGVDFTRITSDNDFVAMPQVKRGGNKVNWLTNRIIDVSTDGHDLAYLSLRNGTTNIFIKDIDKQGSSVQRTNRQAVMDFAYSPDGKYICFSEKTGKFNQIFQTSASSGYVCRQITSNNLDYSPVYSSDMKNVFFARQEGKGMSVWSYNIANNFLSSYTRGQNPYPLRNENSILCARTNAEGRGEIWMVNYVTGVEECILADPMRSFSTPQLSPDGKWIVLVGSNVLMNGSSKYANTDIFVCRPDGTQLTQLTYHAADDLSPVWSRTGTYIYFISQRGSATATANVWRITFLEPM